MPKPVRYVDPDEIRRVFNEGDYEGRAQRGQLSRHVVADREPVFPKAHEPQHTRSQMVEYRRRDGTIVALVHRYLRPDGTIGGSGQHDPKRIYLASEILAVKL